MRKPRPDNLLLMFHHRSIRKVFVFLQAKLYFLGRVLKKNKRIFFTFFQEKINSTWFIFWFSTAPPIRDTSPQRFRLLFFLFLCFNLSTQTKISQIECVQRFF